MSYIIPPIEALMRRKLGETYQRFASSRTRYRILMGKLKEVLGKEVDMLMQQNNMFFPPFDPFQISLIGKAKIKVDYLPRTEIGLESSIVPCKLGFLIRIDSELRKSRKRLRSTMAHELMHTFFYDIDKLPPTRLGCDSSSMEILRMEEELCDFLKRELLIPTFSIRDALLKDPTLEKPSIDRIEYLESLYDISSDIVAYRLIKDLKIWDCIFIKFEQQGSVYRSKTKLKGRLNPIYKYIKIPEYVPLDLSDSWSKILSNLVYRTNFVGSLKENLNFKNKELRLESKVETKKPLTIVVLVIALPA